MGGLLLKLLNEVNVNKKIEKEQLSLLFKSIEDNIILYDIKELAELCDIAMEFQESFDDLDKKLSTALDNIL